MMKKHMSQSFCGFILPFVLSDTFSHVASAQSFCMEKGICEKSRHGIAGFWEITLRIGVWFVLF